LVVNYSTPRFDDNLVVSAEIQHVGAFRGAFGFVYNVTTASVEAVTVQATETIFKAVLSHVTAVASATGKTVREIISGTATGDLPAVLIGFPSGS